MFNYSQFIVHDSNEDPIHQGINGFYVGPGRDVFASVHKKNVIIILLMIDINLM